QLALKLDKSGSAVMLALPGEETPDMQADPVWREMTCDPRYRRVLVSDGRNAVGQAMAKAFFEVGASIVFVGIADPWKPFPGQAELAKIPQVEVVPLDVTDTESVSELAAQNGGRVDIVVNTAEYVRPGGIIERGNLSIARDEMDVR